MAGYLKGEGGLVAGRQDFNKDFKGRKLPPPSLNLVLVDQDGVLSVDALSDGLATRVDARQAAVFGRRNLVAARAACCLVTARVKLLSLHYTRCTVPASLD